MKDHVKAFFAGEWRTMCVRRETLPALEAALNSSAYAVFRRFVAGVWTVEDIRKVLEFSLISDAQAKYAARCAGFGMGHMALHNSPAVVSKTLTSRPVAPYCVLASRVLEAALFGVPEERATFDEREENAEAVA